MPDPLHCCGRSFARCVTSGRRVRWCHRHCFRCHRPGCNVLAYSAAFLCRSPPRERSSPFSRSRRQGDDSQGSRTTLDFFFGAHDVSRLGPLQAAISSDGGLHARPAVTTIEGARRLFRKPRGGLGKRSAPETAGYRFRALSSSACAFLPPPCCLLARCELVRAIVLLRPPRNTGRSLR